MSHAEPLDDFARWTTRLDRWSERLHARGLNGAASALLDAVEPLGPFGAQMLWIAQPALALMAPRDEIASLARLLETPGGIAWLRGRLSGADADDEESHHD